jgi:hypothetical protein
MITCHVFGEIPGVHKSWTLAVMSVGLRDAQNYVKAVHRGGKLVYSPPPGSTVKASCGATTEKAQAEIRAENEREQREYERMKACGEI